MGVVYIFISAVTKSSVYPLGVPSRIFIGDTLRYQVVCEARVRPISNARVKEKAAGRQGYSGSEKKERKRERESKRQVHHGDTPSIILLREK